MQRFSTQWLRSNESPRIFATKKSAAGGSPPAAIGLGFNRICSLPVNLFYKTCVLTIRLLQPAHAVFKRGRRIRRRRPVQHALRTRRRRRSLPVWRRRRLSTTLPVGASRSIRARPAVSPFAMRAAGPVGFHLLPLLRRQL